MAIFKSSYVDVPKDLLSVTHIDSASECAAESAGMTGRQVQLIWEGVERLYQSGAFPGISFCLRRNGKIVLNRGIGHARGNGPYDSARAEKLPMRADTPTCLYSASKAVTAILAHKLAEEGGICLDDPVANYIPEFAQNGKSATTLSHVLAHKGGFPSVDIPKAERKPELLFDWDRIVNMLCEMPPDHKPDAKRRMAYHAITGGFIIGEIIKRVTGKDIRAYHDKVFREPMGTSLFSYGLPAEFRDRSAQNYVAGMPVRFPLTKILEQALMAPIEQVVDVANSEEWMDAVIPAGNMYATAEELSRFYQVLLDNGEYNGKQLLEPETIQRAVRERVSLRMDRTLKIPMRYSEGLMLGANPVGMYGPMTGQAYGHIGFMNIYGWADPQREISCGMLVTGKALLGTHLLALGRLLTTIAKQAA